MRKIVAILFAIVLLLGAAYAAGAWYLGGRVEQAVAEPQKRFESMPYIKIVRRDFQRGMFSSEETVTYELFGDFFRAIGQMQKAQGAAGRPDALPTVVAPKPLVLIAVSHIRHGPLPDGKTMAAAIIDTDFDVEDRFKPALTRVLGPKKPITARTVIALDGNGESIVSSPAFLYAAPAAEGAPPDEFNWGGVAATIRFTSGFTQQTITSEAPRLEVTSPANGGHALVTGMHFESNGTQVFKDEPLLATGKANISVAEIVVDGPALAGKAFRLRNLGYQSSMNMNGGDFLDMAGKFGVAEVTFGNANYGPAHYDFSLTHVHARTFAQIMRAMLKINAESDAAGAGDPAVALQALSGPIMKLLEFNPELGIDRVSFRLPDGDVEMKARARLNEAKAEDFKQPQQLLAKLSATAEISVPAAVLASGFGMRANSPEVLAAQMQARQRQLAALIEHNYLQQDGALLRTKLDFADGQLKVNGQPFDPAVLQAASAPPAQVAPKRNAGPRVHSR